MRCCLGPHRPGVPSSHAVPLSVCTCPACAPPAPLFLLPTAQFLASASRPSADPAPPYFLPCFYQAVHAAFALSVEPRGCSFVCFTHRHPVRAETRRCRLWGGFRRERLLSPPVQVIISLRFPLALCTLKYSQGSEEKQLKTTFCTPNSAEQRTRASAATCPQSSLSRWDPSALGAPHVAPVAPLLPAGTGQGRSVPGANPPSVCVRVSLCVCVRSGCLTANGAWEAQTGG